MCVKKLKMTGKQKVLHKNSQDVASRSNYFQTVFLMMITSVMLLA